MKHDKEYLKNRDEWFKNNQKLVHKIVRNYIAVNPNLNCIKEDLTQAGYMGLIEGYDRYDHNREVAEGHKQAKITSVAYMWSRAFVQKAISENFHSFRVPYTKTGNFNVHDIEELQEETMLVDDSHDTEQRLTLDNYMDNLTPLERECLMYSAGLSETITKEHKPLVTIMASIAKNKIRHMVLQN